MKKVLVSILSLFLCYTQFKNILGVGHGDSYIWD